MKSSHIIAAVALSWVGPVHAQQDPHASHHAQAATVDAEVRKIDKEQNKVTLRHAPIASLDMPAMTMVFRVSDPKMLQTIKVGDKVKFAADKIDGAYTVTALEIVK